MKAKKFLLPTLLCIAVIAFCGCANKAESGQFAWLDSAYESGWFAREDLEEIATLYNAKRQSQSELDETNRENIKAAYCEKLNVKEFYDYVKISAYYGAFGDCLVMEIGSDCEHGGGDPIYYEEYEIDGVKFYGYSPLGVYKKT